LDLKWPSVKTSFQSLIDLYEYLTEQILDLNRKVAALSRSDKYRGRVKLLRSVPGIGVLIAREILVEIQEMARFQRADELASIWD
jgi:transposase